MKTTLKIFCFLLLLLSNFISGGQNRITDTSATCIAFWKNGENRVLQILHGKEKYDSLKQRSKTTVSYEAHIKIIDSTATGFTIEWVYKNFTSSDLNEQSSGEVNTIMEGLKILYKTDDVGSFSELLNWQEVRDFYFNTLEKSLGSKPENKATTSALNQVKAMFQSKENIEAVLIREIQLYHTPYGTEYSLRGETIETALANISGGAPFPAKIIIKLNELNPEKDYCYVSLNQTIDKEKAGPIIIELLKHVGGSSTKDADINKKDIENMEISDLNEFVYSINTGWLSRVIYKRTATISNTKQIETYEITEKK